MDLHKYGPAGLDSNRLFGIKSCSKSSKENLISVSWCDYMRAGVDNWTPWHGTHSILSNHNKSITLACFCGAPNTSKLVAEVADFH